MTRSELAAKANAVCAQSNAYFKKLKLPTADTPKQYAAYLPTLISRLKTEQSTIKALNPGSTEKASLTAYVTNEGQVISDFTKALAAAKSGDASAMQAALKSTGTPGKALVAAARSLVWSECATSGA